MLNNLKQKKIFKQFFKNFSGKYQKIFNESINLTTREDFWRKESREVYWYKNPEKILNSSKAPFYQWFSDGKINMSYNCIDRHIIENRGNTVGIIWESAYSLNKHISYTYDQIFNEVNKLSRLFLEKLGLQKGDRVIIYMPNIPQAMFAMLACSRIGVIHSVVFGGFASDELGLRIKDCNPKLIITASVGIEPKKKIPYLPIVREALSQLKLLNSIPIVLFQREGFFIEDTISKSDNILIYQDELCKISNAVIPACELESQDPLYILYTSGTTGSPKGIFRDIGGTCVALNLAMKIIMGIDKSDVYFSTSDIGWVMGHCFSLYGPLIRGATTIIYEGKPIGTPHCSKYWELCEKHKVKALLTSPTALRAIKKEDPEGKEVKKYNLSSLKSIHVGGERCNPEIIHWIKSVINDNICINNNWGQTETGWPITSNFMNLERFPFAPGSAGKPCPGYDVKIVEEESENLVTTPYKFGMIYIKLPLPPSFMISLWGNKDAFKEKYISNSGEYYITGDAGYFDENGNFFIETRIDDIINVAGHRLSTGRIEEVLCTMDDIAETAVVGFKDDFKGELPFAFVIFNNNSNIKSEQDLNNFIEKAKNKVAHHIGAISKLKGIMIVQRLPKTRSGKILRGILRKILNKETYKLPSTIEDPTVIDEIIEELKSKEIIY